MKFYGYAHESKAQLLELYEVTVAADPVLLRELAQFLQQCADEIQERGARWNHEHFVPTNNQIVKNGPEFIVFNPMTM